MALAILAPGHGHDQRSRGQNARRVVLPSLVQDRLRECGLEKVDLTAPKPLHAGTVDCWGVVKVGSGQASSDLSPRGLGRSGVSQIIILTQRGHPISGCSACRLCEDYFSKQKPV